MKFMKLGSKPDAFQSDGNFIRYVASELATDVIVVVGEMKFYLHKFPLLSKSNRLQKLLSKESEQSPDTIPLLDFPGGPKAFEICAKFCYGMTVTLNPYNVAAARCAAECLEMTEDVDRGNLIFKIEVFLNSSILRSWKDSIILLQTTASLVPWSEDLRVTGRCVDSIASKISVDPASVSWSYTCNRKLAVSDGIHEIRMESVPKDWWVEDVCELEMDLYKRVITAVKSKGRMSGSMIGEALRTYAARWLPDSWDSLASDESHRTRNKKLVETIIPLLPSDKGVCCSCNFLLRLLKVAILVEAEDSMCEDLLKGITVKLDEASVNELLIPARSPQTTIYDVELVKNLVRRFTGREKGVVDVNAPGDGFVLGRRSWVNLGKLVDSYLEEVAHDPGMDLSSFIELMQCVPESSRPIHDGLYGAIDIYLKEHPNMSKAEKKKLCGAMDVRKLTMDASMHAAQNERLPLRTVVQVLYFEQIRTVAGLQALTNISSDDALDSGRVHREEVWEKKPLVPPKNIAVAGKKAQLLPSRSRRIFEKIWGVGKGENRSSETSGSSQSPTSLLQGETTKSSGSSSRNRRHSIS